MDEIKIPLDPMNPGQFFACCGLHDLLDSGRGDVFSKFDSDEAMPRKATFVLAGPNLDLGRLLKNLSESVCRPDDPNHTVEDSISPVEMTVGNQVFRLDWWLNEFCDSSTELKCWAGKVKSAKLFLDLTSLINPSTPADELFITAAMTKSKLGIDPRSAWNALDLGFSPNEHTKDTATFPAVEILGAFGLQGFRPNVRRRRSFYSLWLEALPVSVARIAAYMPWSGLPHLDYEFQIAKRGQSYKYFAFSQVTQENDQEIT